MSPEFIGGKVCKIGVRDPKRRLRADTWNTGRILAEIGRSNLVPIWPDTNRLRPFLEHNLVLMSPAWRLYTVAKLDQHAFVLQGQMLLPSTTVLNGIFCHLNAP